MLPFVQLNNSHCNPIQYTQINLANESYRIRSAFFLTCPQIIKVLAFTLDHTNDEHY